MSIILNAVVLFRNWNFLQYPSSNHFLNERWLKLLIAQLNIVWVSEVNCHQRRCFSSPIWIKAFWKITRFICHWVSMPVRIISFRVSRTWVLFYHFHLTLKFEIYTRFWSLLFGSLLLPIEQAEKNFFLNILSEICVRWFLSLLTAANSHIILLMNDRSKF